MEPDVYEYMEVHDPDLPGPFWGPGRHEMPAIVELHRRRLAYLFLTRLSLRRGGIREMRRIRLVLRDDHGRMRVGPPLSLSGYLSACSRLLHVLWEPRLPSSESAVLRCADDVPPEAQDTLARLEHKWRTREG